MSGAERMRCNLCGSGEGMLVRRGVYGNDRQSVARCAACGHVYLFPLLDDAEEERFYVNEYPAFLLKRGDAKAATPEEQFRKGEGEAFRRLGLVGDLLLPSDRALEIGSASGFFLQALRDRVRSVKGVEPNSEQRAFANKRGLSTQADLAGAGHGAFDVVLLYYVLEHVKDPVAFLKGIRPLLAGASSRLVIEVPNVDEALVSLYASCAYDAFVWQRAHCSYFSVATLGRALTEAGYHSEFRPVQRYDLSNHLHWLAKGEPGGAGRYAAVFSEGLEQEYRSSLERHWRCDSILAIARPLSN